MGGRGNSFGDSNTVLGRGSRVPSEDEIRKGNATYGGLPVKYANMDADARNVTSEIWVSDKFFDHSADTQRHILNHEVAHNLSDDMMMKNSGRWQQFSSSFIKEKAVPKDSPAYRSGQRTYWEGLYGDIGATALSETTTRAITEYLDDPNKLKSRSMKAFNEVRRYMRNR